jgi:hypothetical protein
VRPCTSSERRHSLRTTCLGTPPALTHIPKSTMCEAHSDLPFPHPRTFRTSGLASSEPDPMIPALNIKRQARLRHKEPPPAYPLQVQVHTVQVL